MDSSIGEFPELNQADLDWETVEALATDLKSCAQITEIQIKSSALSFAKPPVPTLDEALARLKSGESRGMQVRYRYQDQDWCDTLLWRNQGVRLVRMKVDTSP